jgi:tRNA threonylcarbamoyladenosine biosynthesis protein TsaB
VLILAVDTTTERQSVAVVESGSVRAEVRLRAVDTHSTRLLPAAAFLLDSLGLAPSAIDGYAVAAGPGAFTGLRVGISTVQGLALAAGKPALGLSALDVLAARITGEAPMLAAMAQAYRGHVFGALYDAEAHPVSSAAAEPPEAFLARIPPGPVAFIGDGAWAHRDLIRERRSEAIFPRRSLFLAGTLGILAEPRLAAGEGVPAAALRPLYLREAHIGPPAR